MPKGRSERRAEFESVCLRDMAGVSVDNGAGDNHWALKLVAEPASRLQETKLLDSGEPGEVVVEGENVGCWPGRASPHRRPWSKQTVDGLLRYAVVISNQDDTR